MGASCSVTTCVMGWVGSTGSMYMTCSSMLLVGAAVAAGSPGWVVGVAVAALGSVDDVAVELHICVGPGVGPHSSSTGTCFLSLSVLAAKAAAWVNPTGADSWAAGGVGEGPKAVGGVRIGDMGSCDGATAECTKAGGAQCMP